MARRRYHHGDLRRALLEASSDLIRVKGAQGFSLREAARAVGVDVAACYRHFPAKEALLHALAASGFAALAQRMLRATSGVRDPTARIVALGKQYLGYARQHPAEFRVMFGDSGTDARDPRLRPTTVRSAYEQLEDAVRAWATARGIAVDVPGIALQLWAAAHGLARLVVDGAVPMETRPSEAALAEIARAILDRAEARPKR